MLEDVQKVEESSKNDNLEPRTTSLKRMFWWNNHFLRKDLESSNWNNHLQLVAWGSS